MRSSIPGNRLLGVVDLNLKLFEQRPREQNRCPSGNDVDVKHAVLLLEACWYNTAPLRILDFSVTKSKRSAALVELEMLDGVSLALADRQVVLNRLGS